MIALTIDKDNVYLEAIPGMLSFVCTRAAWIELSDDSKRDLLHAILDRLGVGAWKP